MSEQQKFTKGKLLDKLSLSYSCKQVILGGLLGKGFMVLDETTNSPRYSFEHRAALREYGAWKADFLREIGTPDCLIIHKTIGYGVGNKITYKSAFDDRLSILYNYLHKSNQLHILRRWLNYLDKLALLVWWLDVGCIIDSGRRGVFRTDNMPLLSIQVLSRFLKVNYSINSTIVRHGCSKTFRGPYFYRLYLSSVSFRQFLKLISGAMTVSPNGISLPMMLYKFKLLYTDKILQQRWISELQDLMPHYRQEISLLYEYRFTMLSEFESDVLKFRPASESDFFAKVKKF